jgi:hypothetical protein
MAPLRNPSDTHGRLIAASKVMNVYDRAGDKLGSAADELGLWDDPAYIAVGLLLTTPSRCQNS